MNLPAALVALVAAGYGVFLYQVPGGGQTAHQVGVAYWIIAAFGFAIARWLRRRPAHRRKRTLWNWKRKGTSGR